MFLVIKYDSFANCISKHVLLLDTIPGEIHENHLITNRNISQAVQKACELSGRNFTVVSSLVGVMLCEIQPQEKFINEP